jgi:hypothetical protein
MALASRTAGYQAANAELKRSGGNATAGREAGPRGLLRRIVNFPVDFCQRTQVVLMFFAIMSVRRVLTEVEADRDKSKTTEQRLRVDVSLHRAILLGTRF